MNFDIQPDLQIVPESNQYQPQVGVIIGTLVPDKDEQSDSDTIDQTPPPEFDQRNWH